MSTGDSDIWVGDLETDGFLEEATVIWCAVFKNLETGRVFSFDIDGGIAKLLPGFLDRVNTVVFHNGICFDVPILKKILGYELPSHKILDTLIMSRLSHPDRKVPRGWVGKHLPHSIEAWGMRFGRPKPSHEDWSKYSPEMLHRCREDVEITIKTFRSLREEMSQ